MDECNLLPLTACCPTHATICEILMVEPLEPHSAMMSGELWRGSSCRHTVPAVSRTVDRIPSTSHQGLTLAHYSAQLEPCLSGSRFMTRF